MKTLDQTLMDQRVERLLAEVEEARTTAQYWKAEHLAGNAEIERLRAERDRALDRIAEMAAELDTPYAWHHLHHGLRYERGDGDGWWPLYMVTKPEEPK